MLFYQSRIIDGKACHSPGPGAFFYEGEILLSKIHKFLKNMEP